MATETKVLPPELLEMQLAQAELLLDMYPEERSITNTTAIKQLIQEVRHYCSSKSEFPLLNKLPPALTVLLGRDLIEEIKVIIHIDFPLYSHEVDEPSESPNPRVSVREVSFMTRARTANFNQKSKFEELDEDAVTAIGIIEDAIIAHYHATLSPAKEEFIPAAKYEPLNRVWFYFPSISTRSKRDDLINNAPDYNLTGFLLAGKPGFLCLEGTSVSIDAYMKFIKTESWGDIPAHHKKVSERYRETGDAVKREFEGMSEVTDDIGERRGERANRTDMRAFEGWLGQRGFGNVMKKLVI